MIFETDRLLIREFKTSDIQPFHNMHANPKVMIYTDSGVKTMDEDVLDLAHCMNCYTKKDNRFWVWAVTRKQDNQFLGSVAIIEYDKVSDEVGFRFLEEYWNNGYGFEVLKGLLKYAKSTNCNELYAEVYAKNKASEIILRKAGFTFVKEYLCPDTKLIDRLFKITLS